jgi:hypothetical protein
MNAPSSQTPTIGRPLRIVVLGYIVRGPLGGMAWHHLQYVLGLVRLGHDVVFIEDSDDYPSCYDPSRDCVDTDATFGLQFTAAAFQRLGLDAHWAYYDSHQARWHGPVGDRAPAFAMSADLLLNVSGVNPLRPWTVDVPVRILIDTDPVFTQVRHLQDPAARDRAKAHNAFFSFGELFGTAGTSIPDDGFRWHPTRQPIVLDAWPVTTGSDDGCLTTVMQWQSYASCRYDGQYYGMKADSFADCLAIPASVSEKLEVAAGGRAPLELLRRHGWRTTSSLDVTCDPWKYQRYIMKSRGEFSVAKHGYVAAHSGWFSERSACYLAAGRPVVLQDTGFSKILPTGVGLCAFGSSETAVAAVRDVAGDYQTHCRAAREIAEAYFDAGQVLAALIEAAFSQVRHNGGTLPSESTAIGKASADGPIIGGRTTQRIQATKKAIAGTGMHGAEVTRDQ